MADRVDAAARARLLAGAVAELDAGDRDVLLLTSWAGLDSNEVATDTLDPSEAGTVLEFTSGTTGVVDVIGVKPWTGVKP